METKYTFSIENDFPNSKVAPDRLYSEIVESEIVTEFSRIVVGLDNADDCDIWFMSELSETDETILDDLVALHSGEPLPPILPYGHFVFQLPSGSTKWERFRQVIPFTVPMASAPTTIEFSNVILSGVTNLQLEEKNELGFTISIQSIGRGDQLGPNAIEFDWEIVE